MRLLPALRAALLAALLAAASAQRVLIGDLQNGDDYGVSGTVYAVDTRTLVIEDFTYDGNGPAVSFWVDAGSSATAGGRPVPFKDTCTEPQDLPAYTGETVELELPADLTISDVGYFSVWCRAANADFGGLRVDPAALDAVPPLQVATCAESGSSEMNADFPVRQGWNCEPLSSNFQVRWQIDGPNANFELVARLNGEDRYMGFGPSGSDARTDMIGSDVAIAFRQGNEYFAVDYHMNGRNSCSGGSGVCPDTVRVPTNGANDISNVEGDQSGNLTLVRYTRPLAAVDPDLDRPIVTTGQSFVSWALGPINPDNLLPQFHGGPMENPIEDVPIEFGRNVENRCSGGFTDAPPPVDVPGFERNVLYNVTDITARIGPSGGARGVSSIRDGPAWGIAWYLSETGSTGQDVLIPVLGVERGKTYRFTVYGGVQTSATNSQFHPMYITSNEQGGFANLSPEDRAAETVYAGIDQIERDENGGITKFRAPAQGALCRFKTTVNDTAEVETFEEYYDSFDTSCVDDQSITDNAGELVWTVAENTPDMVYYQCVTHGLLGYKVRVFDAGETDEAELRQISGGGPLNGPASEESECKVMFKENEEMYQGCRKGLTGDVEVYWNISETTGEIDTLFRAPKGVGYVGFGWGYDRMIGSNVAIVYEQESGAGIGDYLMTERNPQGVQPNNNQQFISSDAHSSEEFLTGKFTRRLSVEGLPLITNGDTPAIWAVGATPTSPTSLQRHSRRDDGTINLSEGTSEDDVGGGGSRVETIFIVHAVFMGLSWLVFVPFAVCCIRYFKKYNPVTFNVHRGINSFAVLLTVIAYIMAVARGSHTETAHLVIGSIVLGLALVQVLGGTLRPHKGTSARKPWYFFHAASGSLAGGLGIANVFVGIGTAKIGGPTGWYVAAGIVTGLFVLVNIALAFMPSKFPVKEADDDLKGGYDGDEMNATERGPSVL